MSEAYWLSLLSGLFGSIVGGLVTWLVTRDSIQRQFSNQIKMLEQQEYKSNVSALKSVKSEIEFNIIQLGIIDKLLDEKKIDFINYKASGLESGIKNTKWEKYNDTLEEILVPKDLNIVTTFYLNFSVELKNQAFNRNRLDKLIRSGFEAKRVIQAHLDQLSSPETLDSAAFPTVSSSESSLAHESVASSVSSSSQ